MLLRAHRLVPGVEYFQMSLLRFTLLDLRAAIGSSPRSSMYRED